MQVTKEDMINITSCSITDFTSYMSKQFGSVQFTEGFKITRTHFDLIYEDDGEERMIVLLAKIFPDKDEARGFINFCTTYLIVQNMQFAN